MHFFFFPFSPLPFPFFRTLFNTYSSSTSHEIVTSLYSPTSSRLLFSMRERLYKKRNDKNNQGKSFFFQNKVTLRKLPINNYTQLQRNYESNSKHQIITRRKKIILANQFAPNGLFCSVTLSTTTFYI